MHSYWENEQWFKNIDFVIIGSGIVGLQCALSLRKKHPKAKITILEKGYLPAGASSKNAGFACFGSPSEILDDLKTNTPEQVAELVELRAKGLERLKLTCGVESMNFQQLGSHEIFTPGERELYQNCSEQLAYLNQLLRPIFKEDIFEKADDNITTFGFKNVEHLIYNKLEGQIDTGAMINKLLHIATSKEITILNGAEVVELSEGENFGLIKLQNGVEVKAKMIFVANNGFAKKLLPELDIEPARAQVLITKPIDNLEIKGTFHLLEGYYYFRNVKDRILFGGGRNLDFEGETTSQLETTQLIQNDLEQKLREIILPNKAFEIDQRWAGVMGVGKTKKPIVKKYTNHIICGVRMGGMGVAIGSLIGEEMSNILD